jgi:hypothetical protein
MEPLQYLLSSNAPTLHPYRQYAFKVAIKATNTSAHPRPMTEYRTGYDGTIELDPITQQPKQLLPGESRWIAIEPSSKHFRFRDVLHNDIGWGAAAYPKKLMDAKKQWIKMNPSELPMYYKRLTTAQLVIPYEQIADTLRSLYPSIAASYSMESLVRYVKEHRLSADFGFPGKVQLFLPTNRGMGYILTKKFLKSLPPPHVFPAKHAGIPLEVGALVLIEPAKGSFEYRDPQTNAIFTFPKLVRIIDAPARKAAIWKKEE